MKALDRETHAVVETRASAKGNRVRPRPRGRAGLIAAGSAALLYAVALATIGEMRNDGRLDVHSARWLLVGTSVPAAAVYFFALWRIRDRAFGRIELFGILAVGLLARVLLLPSDPIFVSDFYRYLWDGAVTASGENPWRYAPQSVQSAMEMRETPPGVPPRLVELGRDSGRFLHRINQPHLSTIYPPTAQVVFVIAHWIKPWSVEALRGVLLLFDVATVGLLVALLRVLGRPPHDLAWYWWNPLFLREISHSAHMDVIALPLVVLALLLVIRRSTIAAGLVLTLAVGAKLWPVVLLPLLVRAAGRRTRRKLAFVGVFLAASAALWAPVLAAGFPESSGFRAYAVSWHDNNAVFQVIEWLTRLTLAPTAFADGLVPYLTRAIVVGLLAAWIIVQTGGPAPTAARLIRRSLAILAVLFFLSPTQFPWYYVWMLPLLAAVPRASLLAYAAFLPLYYLHDQCPWVVWIEHLPILAWFTVEQWKVRNPRWVWTPVVEAA